MPLFPPSILYFLVNILTVTGVYLSDLTFIEDGNPNMLRNNDRLINFSKRMKTSEVIRDLQQYQTVPYPFVRVNELQMWLDNELTNSSEIQELYDLSTQVEPREREDEKMYPLPPRDGCCVSLGIYLSGFPVDRCALFAFS
jgi:son of sevenless-like protein